MVDSRMRRVLIVDDQIYFCRLAREILGKGSLFSVLGEAHDAHQAIGMVDELKPDVILMDVEMEGLDGLEATRLIRSRFPEVQVILMSVYDESEYDRLALRAGALAFISKKGLSAPVLAQILNEGSLKCPAP